MLTTKPFGAFVELHGYRTHGLVHISQLAQYRVEAVEDVVESGSWVRANPNPSPNPNRSRSRSPSRSPSPSPSPSPDPNQVGTGKSYHRDRVTGELHELSPHELVRVRLGLPLGLGLA